MSYRRRLAERAVKANLVDQLERSGVDPREAAEWLWDDFGKRVKPDWRSIRKAILGDPNVTAQDIAVFMLDNGVQPEEGAWDVLPRRGLRGGPPHRGDS